VNPAHAARPWSEIFKRPVRRDEPVVSRAAASQSSHDDGSDAVVRSKVLPKFVAAVAQRPAPVLVDLGPVVGSNIAFFGDRLCCKIHVQDLFADVEAHAQRGERDRLAAFLETRLALEPGTVDGILCWDLFDFLDPAAGQTLAGRLAALLRPGGVLHGCFGTTPVELHHYTRSVIEPDQTLRQRRYPATAVRRHVIQNRDIMRMFGGLTLTDSVLLQSSTRETLFRRGS
jgi:hypothetical protein